MFVPYWANLIMIYVVFGMLYMKYKVFSCLRTGENPFGKIILSLLGTFVGYGLVHAIFFTGWEKVDFVRFAFGYLCIYCIGSSISGSLLKICE